MLNDTAYHNYKVSDDGRVWSMPRDSVRPYRGGTRPYRVPGGWLKPRAKRNGYMQVCLRTVGGVTVYEYVHRLVAKAFVAGQFVRAEVNHLDGNKANNAASNLEWCTSSENSAP